jgi:hypothetical protein
MLKLKFSVAYGVLIASLVLTFGLVVWLQSASPVRVAVASGLIDDSLSDFEFGSGCFVAQSSGAAFDGEVIVSPTIGTNFSGTVLPLNWFTTGSGTVTVADGLLTVDQDRTGPLPPRFSPGRVLEFVATFTQTTDQHIGFGQFFQDITETWAIFSTRADGAQLWARTNDGASETVTPLGTGYFSQPHLYRVEWGTSSITYTIDGLGVATHTVQIADTMRPQVMDSNDLSHVLTVDWLRMSDYAPSPCTFTSRVIDSGLDGSTFTGLSTTLVTPAGTAIAFEVITSTNNITWGTWTAVNFDGSFSAGAARYMRYRAGLSTSEAQSTPQLQRVTVHGYGPPPTAVHVTSFSVADTHFAARGLLIGLSSVVLAVGGVSAIFRRRRIAS